MAEYIYRHDIEEIFKNIAAKQNVLTRDTNIYDYLVEYCNDNHIELNANKEELLLCAKNKCFFEYLLAEIIAGAWVCVGGLCLFQGLSKDKTKIDIEKLYQLYITALEIFFSGQMDNLFASVYLDEHEGEYGEYIGDVFLKSNGVVEVEICAGIVYEDGEEDYTYRTEYIDLIHPKRGKKIYVYRLDELHGLYPRILSLEAETVPNAPRRSCRLSDSGEQLTIANDEWTVYKKTVWSSEYDPIQAKQCFINRLEAEIGAIKAEIELKNMEVERKNKLLVKLYDKKLPLE